MGRRPAGNGPKRPNIDEVEAPPPRSDLPDGWQRCTDSNGAPYFWNPSTGVTSWDLPQAQPSPGEVSNVDLRITEAEAEALEPDARTGWLKLLTHTGPGRIRLATRLEDWRDGGLSTAFFCRRIREALIAAADSL